MLKDSGNAFRLQLDAEGHISGLESAPLAASSGEPLWDDACEVDFWAIDPADKAYCLAIMEALKAQRKAGIE